MRVGIITNPFGIGPSDDVGRVVAAALAELRATDAGDLMDAELGMPVPREIFEALWVTGRGLGFADLIRTQGEEGQRR